MSKERYVATLMGCAIGDTLGMAVEGFQKEKIERYVGRITEPIASLSPYTKGLRKGEYTDDTILTIAITESIAEKKCLDLEDICKKQIEAYDACKLPDGRVRGGWGGTTKKAFERIKSGISPYESGVAPGLGTGPPMKMSPIGLYMTDQNYFESEDMARKIGESTHRDERAIAAGIVQARAVYALLQDAGKLSFIRTVLDTSYRVEKPFNRKVLPERGNLTSKLEWVYNHMDVSDAEAHKHLGSTGLVLEAYPFTVFMFQKYWDKPVEGLIETVNFGGDCDTTGAMFGALAGAKNGMIFPEEWVKATKDTDRLADLGKGIWEIKKKVTTLK